MKNYFNEIEKNQVCNVHITETTAMNHNVSLSEVLLNEHQFTIEMQFYEVIMLVRICNLTRLLYILHFIACKLLIINKSSRC